MPNTTISTPRVRAAGGEIRIIGVYHSGRCCQLDEKAADQSMGASYLGEERFPETLSGLEIEHFFTLDEDELASVRERRGPLNRLALALQIGFLKMTGRTLNSVELIPPQILDHLGRQVDCVAPRIASIRAFYRRRHRTLFEHHATALRLLGRSELIPHAERGLVAYLRREAAAVFDLAESHRKIPPARAAAARCM